MYTGLEVFLFDSRIRIAACGVATPQAAKLGHLGQSSNNFSNTLPPCPDVIVSLARATPSLKSFRRVGDV